MASSSRFRNDRQRTSDDLKLVTLREGAAEIGVCERTLRNWIYEGRLTGYKLGPRMVRIDRNELLTLLRPYGGPSEGFAS